MFQPIAPRYGRREIAHVEAVRPTARRGTWLARTVRSPIWLACVGATVLAVPLVGQPAAAYESHRAAVTGNATDGPASISLPACGQGSAIGTEPVPDCSYVALPQAADGLYYAHLTSQGGISWAGTAKQGVLNFPVAGQSWPTLDFLNNVVTATAEPSDITGTVDANGTVALTIRYATTIRALGFACSARGQVALSSAATDPVGGGRGRAVDPATGRFAVAATSATPPTLTGAACAQAADFVDLSKGLGWYLVGDLAVDDPPTANGTIVRQKARVSLPKRIARKGKTVVVKTAVVTNAGQTARAKVTWNTRRSAKGKRSKYAKVTTTKTGRSTIRTTGRAKRLYVKLRLSAPAADGYTSLRRSKVWTVK